MNNTKLKPCPFCGNAVALKHGGIEGTSRTRVLAGDYCIEWSITCQKCGIPKIIMTGRYILNNDGNLENVENENVKDEIVRLWNRRVELSTDYQ